MAKRLFISFAIEDVRDRDFLVGQSRNDRTPFEFFDMSVKKPWDSEWKKRCRSKIVGCDGMITLVSKNTAKATGQLWEIQCAKDEKIPVRGLYTTTNNRPLMLPSELSGVTVMTWTWDNLEKFINSL